MSQLQKKDAGEYAEHKKTDLNKANGLGIATKALSAAHESIFSDQPMWITAYSAETHR